MAVNLGRGRSPPPRDRMLRAHWEPSPLGFVSHVLEVSARVVFGDGILLQLDNAGSAAIFKGDGTPIVLCGCKTEK
jgi:hypothetical protein